MGTAGKPHVLRHASPEHSVERTSQLLKRCAQTAFAAALAAPLTLIPAEAAAASAGCNTLNGVMATDVPDGMSTFTTRTVTLKKGEKITVTTTGGGAGTDTRVTINKQPGGNVFNDQYNNAGNTTFTIPSDGTYVVTVENNAVGANSKITIGCSGSTAGGANGFDPTPEQKAQIANALLLSMLLVTPASAPLQAISTAMFGINPPFIDLDAFLKQAEAQLARLKAELAETERDRRLIQAEIEDQDAEQKRILRGILYAEQIEAPVSQDSVRRYNELVDQLSRARSFIFETLDPQIKDLKERIRLTERAIDAIKRMQGTTQTGGNATGGGNFAPLSSAPVSISQGRAGGKQVYVDITALMADPNKGDRLWLNGGARPQDAAGAGQTPPLRLWAGLNHVDFDDDRTGADRDGDITTFTGGAHYALDPDSAVGGYFTFRTGDVSSTAMASTLDSDAFGFGAYATRRLNEEITGSASLEYAHGDHDIAIAGATGNFDTDEFRATAGLKGRYLLSGLIGSELIPGDISWIEPTASISYTNVARALRRPRDPQHPCRRWRSGGDGVPASRAPRPLGFHQ